MNVVYYFSELKPDTGFLPEVSSFLKEDFKNKTKIVFISANPDNDEISNIKAKNTLEMFKKINIAFKHKKVITNSTNKESAKEELQNSDAIFLLGGNPAEQYKLIINKELVNIIKTHKGVILGISAGSMNLSEKVFMVPIENRKEYSDYCIFDALNINGINIFPHFNIKSTNDVFVVMDINQLAKMAYLKKAFGNDKVYCLPDNSCIRISNDKTEILNEDYYLYNNNKFKKMDKTY